MNYSEISNKDFDNPIKKCWKLGDTTLVAVDKSIVNKLGINENDTFLEQIITDNGDILMQVRKIEYKNKPLKIK
jgi:hypothetical protein